MDDTFDFNGDDPMDKDNQGPDLEIPSALSQPDPFATGHGLIGVSTSPVVHAIGEEDGGGSYCQQDTDFTCAVVSQQMVLKDFGIDVSETQLAVEATQNGWLSTDGTQPADVGKLLELHGIPCHQGFGMDGIVRELAQGHKVIVGVDSSELWDSGGGPDWMGPNPDHAVVLQGLRQHEDGSWTVVVNDPGHPDGEGKEYPLDHFTKAADDSQFFYVATDVPPPDLENHPDFGAGYNASTGHYDGVMEWLSHNGDNIRQAAGIGVGVGAASLLFRPGETKVPLTEKERDNLLRKI